nr:DUF6188 family protein [Streptomyces sp. DSM 40713]
MLTLSDGAELILDGPLHITEGPAAVASEELPVLQLGELTGATVVSAVAFKSGLVRVVFNTGHHLIIRGGDPGVKIEIRKPNDFYYSCLAGVGEMSVID